MACFLLRIEEAIFIEMFTFLDPPSVLRCEAVSKELAGPAKEFRDGPRYGVTLIRSVKRWLLDCLAEAHAASQIVAGGVVRPPVKYDAAADRLYVEKVLRLLSVGMRACFTERATLLQEVASASPLTEQELDDWTRPHNEPSVLMTLFPLVAMLGPAWSAAAFALHYCVWKIPNSGLRALFDARPFRRLGLIAAETAAESDRVIVAAVLPVFESMLDEKLESRAPELLGDVAQYTVFRLTRTVGGIGSTDLLVAISALASLAFEKTTIRGHCALYARLQFGRSDDRSRLRHMRFLGLDRQTSLRYHFAGAAPSAVARRRAFGEESSDEEPDEKTSADEELPENEEDADQDTHVEPVDSESSDDETGVDGITAAEIAAIANEIAAREDVDPNLLARNGLANMIAGVRSTQNTGASRDDDPDYAFTTMLMGRATSPPARGDVSPARSDVSPARSAI